MVIMALTEQLDTRLDFPCSIIICGQPSSGKSHLCLSLVEKRDTVFKFPVEAVVFVYQNWQKEFDSINEKDPNVTFTPDLFSIDSIVKKQPELKWLVIIDDHIISIESNPKASQFVAEFFIHRATHQNCLPVFITHNLFSKSVRIMSLNCSYLILFKAIRDKSQISVLGNQLGCGSFLRNALDSATEQKFGYLLIDVTRNTPECLRFRNFIWEKSDMLIFVPPQCASVH
jgi:hypothetical protein